jgi:RNA polymerase sigma factor (sigma-70 family)
MVLMTLSIGAMAQTKAVRIESPIVSEKDFVWYTEQKEAWKALTQKDPTNETTWLNYYNAARYISWFQQKDSTAKQVVSEMEAVIPDSYTFNFCAYRESVQGKGYGDPKKYAEAALAKLPDEMQFFDYDNWVCYLAMQGDEARMKPLAKRYFHSGIYSEAVLRYSYNELAGMDEGGIYIANGDAADLAADFMHDTFLRLYAAREKYHEGSSFRAWLYTIAYNLCKNYLRNQLTVIHDDEKDIPAEADLEVELDEAILHDALREALKN